MARELRNDIESGRLRVGEKLPTTRHLADQWNVGLGTVNKAMDLLTADGLIITRARQGRVVADTAAITAARRPKLIRPRAVFIGGYAGSGKTETGRIMARETGWAMLDKDTITRSVVDKALVELGSTIADRESAMYLEVVRPAEYQCLEAAVMENIGCGVSVIATAPYLREFDDPAWFERTSAALSGLGADMTVIWIRCSTASMKSYVERRGAARDTWKLNNWDKYVETVDEEFSPPWPHIVIRNNPADEPIPAQVKAFVRDLDSTR
ncbi:GntR family transcriptional regulator [Nocardia nova]|nr:GntR family transcriptional regulator [Nocardia nova]